MKIVYSVLIVLGFLAFLVMFPITYIGSYLEGDSWAGGGYLALWLCVLFGIIFTCLREGERRVGEATGVLKESEYYKLLKQIDTTKGRVLLMLSRDGTLSASIYNDRADQSLIEGRWYRPERLNLIGISSSLYLEEVEDELAVAVLNKGYRPQWST